MRLEKSERERGNEKVRREKVLILELALDRTHFQIPPSRASVDIDRCECASVFALLSHLSLSIFLSALIV